MSFGTYLQEQRRKAGLSLRDLGKQAGVNHVTIYHIESDVISPRLETIHKLAVGLKDRSLLLRYERSTKCSQSIR